MSDEFDTLEEIADMRVPTKSPRWRASLSPESRAAYKNSLGRAVANSHDKFHNWSKRKAPPITLPVIKAFEE